MIREMKREALQSLKGRWGLGVGGTILYVILSYVVSLVATFIVMIPCVIILLLGAGTLGGFEEETITVGGIVIFFVIYALLGLVSLASYGITMYGYMNMFLQISRKNHPTIDSLFEGFRGFKRMMKVMKSMVLIFLYTGSWIPFILTGIFLIIAGDNNTPGAESLGIAFFVLLCISCIIVLIAYLSYTITYFVMVDYPEYSVLQAMKESKAMMKGHKMDLFLLWLSFIGWMILAICTFGIGFLWLFPYMTTTTATFYDEISKKHEH